MTIEQQAIKELSLALAERDERIAALEEVLRLKELELKQLRGQVNEE